MLMNGFGQEMVKSFLTSKNYKAITEFAKICNDQFDLYVESYQGESPRVYIDHGIHLIVPEHMSNVQMEAVADAVANGTIFDDSEDLDNHATYVMMKSCPYGAMCKTGVDEPKHLKIVISGIIGKMSDDGTLEISLTDLQNGKQFIDQVRDCDPSNADYSDEVNKLTDHYLGTSDHYSLPRDLKSTITKMKGEVNGMKSLEDEDVVDDTDYEELDIHAHDHDNDDMDHPSEDIDDYDGDTDAESSDKDHEDLDDDPDADEDEDTEIEKKKPKKKIDQKPDKKPEKVDLEKEETPYDDAKPYEEFFFSKKPKKLKPIPRDVVAYITVELNAIKDSNDQAMLSGYTCSKLDLVDFYINCIDTQDARYIVPHTRQYLVQMQNDLNRLLTQILNIRARGAASQLWKPFVTLPGGR